MKPSSTKLSDQVTDCIREDILTCRLKPGTRLKIAGLCGMHSVSLGAVREALSRLSAEGLVIAEPQKGYTVAPVSHDELRDLTQTRIDIEQLCLRRSIDRGDLDWEAQIVAARHRLANTPYRDHKDSPEVLSESWARAHQEFHESLVAACGSPILLEIRGQLYARSERYRRLSVPLDKSDRDVSAEHEALSSAVLERDAAAACLLIADHLNRTTEILLTSGSEPTV